jgi:hypothetical protein
MHALNKRRWSDLWREAEVEEDRAFEGGVTDRRHLHGSADTLVRVVPL